MDSDIQNERTSPHSILNISINPYRSHFLTKHVTVGSVAITMYGIR